MADTETKIDIAILGGGLAGSLLARQLRINLTDASISVFERRAETSLKVGESSVEIGANYLIRKLGRASARSAPITCPTGPRSRRTARGSSEISIGCSSTTTSMSA